jgi:hypothetical protein
MSSNKRFELPVEGMEDEYIHSLQDEALFGPLARKTMVIIALTMLAIFGLGILVSYPLTIIPFLLGLLGIHHYRKMRKNYHRKKNRIHRK